MSRLKAFSLHIALSGIIAFIAIWLVFFIWYPAPLHIALNVTTIFLILLLIDVILGPFLTLLIYKPNKKNLFIDINIIILLQLSALTYGLYTVAEARPAWLVFAKDHFELIRINDIDARKLSKAANQYRQPSLFGPQWVAAESPTNIEEKNDILLESVFAGVDIAQRPNLYQPLKLYKDAIKHRLLELSVLSSNNQAANIQAILAKYPEADTWLPLRVNNPWQPLRANNQDMVVLMHKETAEVVAIVDLRPWN